MARKFKKRAYSLYAPIPRNLPFVRASRELSPKDNPETGELIFMIGLRIDPMSDQADLFTLVVMGDHDFFVERDDRFLFFGQPDQAAEAYAFVPDAFKGTGSPVPDRVTCVIDIAQALRVIDTKDTDESRELLETLNLLLDFVRESREPMPFAYRDAFYRLADHLTFKMDFRRFIARAKISRRTVRDGILWSLGVVLSRATTLR